MFHLDFGPFMGLRYKCFPRFDFRFAQADMAFETILPFLESTRPLRVSPCLVWIASPAQTS